MKKWSEVEQSKEFQSLPTDQKETARNQYFSEIIAPQIPEDKRASAKTQFDADTAGKDKHSSEEYEPLKKAVTGALKVKKMAREAKGAVVEPILSMASSMLAKPVSEVVGLAATGYEMATGGKNADQISGFKKEVQDKLTYEPKTEAGKSPYNALNAIPMAVGKGIAAITPDKAKPGEGGTLAGAARNFASEAIPQAIGILGAKYAGNAAAPVEKIAKTLRTGAEDLMQSALKPTAKDLLNGKAAKAIDTMLEKGINATPKGMEKMRAQIDVLNDQIKDVIANSPERVETAKMARPVVQKLKEFREQANPDADINAIKKSWNEFKNHPLLQHETPAQVIPRKVDPQTGASTPEKVIPAVGKEDMSVQTAQAIKQGTYKQLSKKYGQLGSAEVESQKAIARGLKDQIAEKVPAVEKFNAEESKLLNVLSVAERRIVMEANKNPMGLSLLTKDPKVWAAFMADRSATAKSLLARIMNRTSEKLTGSGTARAAKTGSVIAPTQTSKEKKQYEMRKHPELENK